MKSMTYTVIHTFIIMPILMTTMTILSMEKNYPQLQLQEPKDESRIIHGKLSIHPVFSKAMYPLNTNACSVHGSSISFKEPYISVNIIDNSHQNNPPTLIPAKTLYNCNDGSRITLIFEKYKAHVTCHKEPKLLGKSFKKQYISSMKKFYEKPLFSPHDTTAQQLISMDIIAQTTTTADNLINFYAHNKYGRRIETQAAFMVLQRELIYEHGKNGCPNEKTFIEIITEPYIKPYNNSIFQFTIRRQYGNINYCKKLQPTIARKTQALTDEQLAQQIEDQLTLEQK